MSRVLILLCLFGLVAPVSVLARPANAPAAATPAKKAAKRKKKKKKVRKRRRRRRRARRVRKPQKGQLVMGPRGIIDEGAVSEGLGACMQQAEAGQTVQAKVRVIVSADGAAESVNTTTNTGAEAIGTCIGTLIKGTAFAKATSRNAFTLSYTMSVSAAK